MSSGYMIGSALGFFFIYAVFMIFALFFAKYKGGWILYGIGGCFQLVSLIGNQIKVIRAGVPFALDLYWIIYVLTMVALFALIKALRTVPENIWKKKKDEKNQSDSKNSKR